MGSAGKKMAVFACFSAWVCICSVGFTCFHLFFACIVLLRGLGLLCEVLQELCV